MDWPPIAEPLLLERLGMDDAAFLAFIDQAFGALPARAFTPVALATALGYPWERPERSYLLTGKTVALLDDLGAERRDALLHTREAGPDGARRFPLLAFGSNGAPSTLARKLAHLPEDERRLLVLAGELHGFDVGASSHPTAYGALPASLFESPGTAVRAAILWVSVAQLTQLCWTEVSYRLGRLDGVAFSCDQPTGTPDTVLTFAARQGTFCPAGEPVALAAIPARGRTARALTQEELLDRAARLALGKSASAEALVRVVFAAPGTLAEDASRRLRAVGRPFAPTAWTPFAPPPRP